MAAANQVIEVVEARRLTHHQRVRRGLLGAAVWPWLAACSTPLPLDRRPAVTGAGTAAAARLRDCAEAHGLSAYRQLTDISVAYDGQWRPLVGRIQPEVVDAGFRGRSEERLLPTAGVVAQAYTGPQGRKQVAWRRGGGGGGGGGTAGGRGEVAVWLNGTPSAEAARQQAAALVAEAYGLFLLGPLWLIDRGLAMEPAGTERVDGRLCDVVHVWVTPGLGLSANDRVALCIDREGNLMRRVRFTLEGFVNTRGAVAEVDTFDHARHFGITWPMRSFERIVHPIALPAHDWHITGLDVNRGLQWQDVSGPVFTGLAAAPAAPLQR